MQPILIYGPAACGKTRNAQALKTHYGARQIVDGFNPIGRTGQFSTDNGPPPRSLEGAVILTNLGRDEARRVAERLGARCLSFDHAKKEARL
ncbi:MAG TPA: hypothetical protein DC031_01490 [Sulfitobacter sp.]|jgi:hypothetical protein|uniref:hypothetical protein n=1 Tax=Sulfitobacter dubius TaxID=218673 RepID=UPI000E8A7BCF|nr:hypothetical protein [Sulfitobacter sp.]